MPKKKHPHNRAERLALKELHEDQTKRASVRRKLIKESLKEREADDDLREYKGLAGKDQSIPD